MEDFYDSDLAAEMVNEYKRISVPVNDLLKDAALLEGQIKSMRSLLLYRRRVRLEIRLQRKLLDILLLLSPADQAIGRQVYDKLLQCVARLEKMC